MFISLACASHASETEAERGCRAEASGSFLFPSPTHLSTLDPIDTRIVARLMQLLNASRNCNRYRCTFPCHLRVSAARRKPSQPHRPVAQCTLVCISTAMYLAQVFVPKASRAIVLGQPFCGRTANGRSTRVSLGSTAPTHSPQF